MKKITLFLLLTSFSFVKAIAIDGDPEVGLKPQFKIIASNNTLQFLDSEYTKFTTIGIGFGDLGGFYDLSIPAIGISFERQFLPNVLDVSYVRAGGYIGYAQYGLDFLSSSDYSLNEVTLGTRWGISVSSLLNETANTNILEKFDLYSYLLFGYRFYFDGSNDFSSVDSVSAGTYFGFLVGAHIQMGKVGFFGELGDTEAGVIRFGISFAK